MQLYQLLSNRTAINMLKMLYDKEVIDKASYSMNLSEIGSRISGDFDSAISLLKEGELATIDDLEDDKALSITHRGREFIELLGQMIELFNPDAADRAATGKHMSIKYQLTQQEKKILALCYKMSRDSGNEFIALKDLASELFPGSGFGRRLGIVNRDIKKLEGLNLMHTKFEDKKTFAKVSDSGFKTIKEQYLKGVI